MNIIKISNKNQNTIIKEAVNVLNNGGLIVYPTDTAYGIGADVSNPTAIGKLNRFKGQRKNKQYSPI